MSVPMFQSGASCAVTAPENSAQNACAPTKQEIRNPLPITNPFPRLPATAIAEGTCPMECWHQRRRDHRGVEVLLVPAADCDQATVSASVQDPAGDGTFADQGGKRLRRELAASHDLFSGLL